jgi:hypothetical protein
MTRARLFSQGSGANSTSNVAIASILPSLTTANVVEVTNLYFSNARVLANVRLASINEFKDVESGPKANGQALVWNGFVWAAANVTATSTLANTDGLVEGVTNLYYTNARARTAFTAADPTIVVDWTTGTIRANVTAIANAASTTDGVIEGNVNKYFTNARVFANIQLASLKDLYDVSYYGDNSATIENGVTLVWNKPENRWEPNVYTSGHAFFADIAGEANIALGFANYLTSDDLPEGNISKYLTTALLSNLLANVSIDIFRDVNTQISLATDKVLAWDGTTWIPRSVSDLANVTSAGSSDFAALAGIANVALLANVANTVLTLNNFTTANVRESSANLYFTYARVNTTVQPFLTTANVRESSSNLYFTYARVNTTVQPFLTTANVRESSSNLYFTYERVNATVQPFLTTSNVTEGTNQYFTNARVLLAISTGNATIGRSLTVGDNLSVANDLTVTGNVVTLAVANVQIEARTITLAKDAAVASSAEGAGILINGANARFTYSQASDGMTLNKHLIVQGNILPAVSGVYNLGSVDKKFLSVYLGTQTIYLGNITLGESPSGGLDVKTPSGDPSDGNFANLTSTEQFWINRVYSNVFPLTELNAYIGGNVNQWVSNETGNLYLGVKKDNDYNRFAGIRVVETRTSPLTVRSDVIIYNDAEGQNLSRERVAILGDGNTNITGDIYLTNRTNKFYGNVKGDLIGNVTGTVSSIHNHSTANLVEHNIHLYYTNSRTVSAVTPLLTTSNVVEGTNLYYTNARARTAITGGTGVAVNWGTGAVSIGQDVSTTSDVSFKSITVSGNIYVQGNASYINSNTLTINDPLIQIGVGNPANNFDLGWIGHYKTDIDRHAGFFRDHSDGIFKVFDNLTSEPGLNDVDTSNVTFRYANVQATTFIGNLTGRADTVGTLSNFSTTNLSEGTNKYYLDSRVVTAVTPLLTTANTVEFNNLYHTPARAISAVTPLLTTSNVTETNGLFHYSNSRSLGYIQTLSINELSDVDTVVRTPVAGYVLMYDGSKWVANVVTAFSSPFANLAAVANSVVSLAGHTTTEIAEGANLYYTDARVVSAVSPLLTTSNVTEGTNQYFTNARVSANVELMSINVFADVNMTGLQNNGILIWNGTQFVAGSVSAASSSNVALFSYLAGFANSAAVASTANSVVSLGGHSTSELAEGSNLYYTDARVFANVALMSVNVFADVDITQIQPDGLLLWDGSKFVAGSLANKLTTANVIELTNLYFTNARAVVAIQGADATLGNLRTTGLLTVSSGVGSETTTGIEFANNPGGGTGDTAKIQYYAISGQDTVLELSVANNPEDSINFKTLGGGIGYNVARPTQDVDFDGNTLIRRNLTISNKLFGSTGTFTGKLEANGLTVNGTEIVNGDGGLSNLIATRITANIWNGLYTANVIESPTQLYFTNARVAPALLNQDVTLRELTVTGNLIVQGDVTTLNTATLAVEDKNITIATGATNGAQADGAGITVAGAGGSLTYYVVGDKFLFNKNLDVDGTIRANSWSGLYTSNVVENTQLFFTNARAISTITPLLTTANVAELNNLYYTNARVLSNVEQMSVNVFADVDITGVTTGAVLVWNSNKFVAAQPAASNFANVANSVVSLAGHTTTEIAEGANLYYTDARVIAAVTPTQTTANTVELNNLYYTNARVVSAVVPLLTTSNVAEGANLYFTNARVLTALIDATIQGNLTVANKLTANALVIRGIDVTDTVTAGNVSAGAFSGNSLVVDSITANIWNNLYTANVIESPTKLYYTNARVDSYVSTLSVNVFADVDITGIVTDGILIWNGNTFVAGSIQAAQAANVAQFAYLANVANVATTVVSLSNHTTTDLAEGANLYFSNTRARAALAGQDLSLNNIVANTLVINSALTSAVNIIDVQTPDPYLVTKFDIAKYRSAEFIYTIKGKSTYAGLYNSGKILLLHDDANVYFTQFGILLTGNGTELVSFSADINSSNVRLFASVTDPAIVCDIRLSGTTYTEA